MYVLESGTDRLIRFSAAGERLRETGGFGWGEGGFDRPSDVSALNDLELYVSDFGNDRIVRLDGTLGLVSVFETRAENVTFRFPLSVAITQLGKLLIVDGEFGRIIELGKDDRISRIFGGSGSGRGYLHRPVKVRSDSDQRVLVRDDSGIVVYDTYGNFLRLIPGLVTGPFISFDVTAGGVVLLDTTSVRCTTLDGEEFWRSDLPPLPSTQPGIPVDIRSEGGWVYVLYPDHVIRLRRGGGETPKE